MRVNRFLPPLLVIVTLLGTTFLAQATGLWSTSGRTVVAANSLTVADLKGWMTLQQVLDGLNLSQTELYAAGHIPWDMPTSNALKDLEGSLPDFEITTLRATLSALRDLPAVTPTASASTLITGTPQGAGMTPTPLPLGQVLPADQLKGRLTLREVSTQGAVPLDKLLALLNLPAATSPDTALKDLINAGQLAEVTTVQTAVATLQAQP